MDDDRQQGRIAEEQYVRSELAMSELVGRRLHGEVGYEESRAGDYWKPTYEHRQPNEWWFRDPFGKFGRITKHTVEEHDDGTITVSPSIACAGGGGADFHGWLKHGVWSW